MVLVDRPVVAHVEGEPPVCRRVVGGERDIERRIAYVRVEWDVERKRRRRAPIGRGAGQHVKRLRLEAVREGSERRPCLSSGEERTSRQAGDDKGSYQNGRQEAPASRIVFAHT